MKNTTYYTFSHYYMGCIRYISNLYTSDTNLDVYWATDKKNAYKFDSESEEYKILATLFTKERVVEKVKRWIVGFDFSDIGMFYLIEENYNGGPFGNSSSVEDAMLFDTRDAAIQNMPNVYKTTFMPDKVNYVSIKEVEVEL